MAWYKNSRSRRRRFSVSIERLLIGVVFVALVGFFQSTDWNADDFAGRVVGQANSLLATAPSTLVGRAAVIDGDTIEIHGERIRLHGIDAPESNQLCQDKHGKSYRCGAVSANALDKLVNASQPISCDFVERDQYDRFVGNCYRPDRVNLAASMVRSGLALDWPRHSDGLYAEENAAARAERLGLWQGDFTPPWDWRAQQHGSARQEELSPASSLFDAAAAPNCSIKGNISNKGERIYHVPGQEFYTRTKISEGKGERWFCTEDEASGAGWRRARR